MDVLRRYLPLESAKATSPRASAGIQTFIIRVGKNGRQIGSTFASRCPKSDPHPARIAVIIRPVFQAQPDDDVIESHEIEVCVALPPGVRVLTWPLVF